MFTTLACIACLIAGYVARKYVEKRWPDKAAELDARAKDLGERIGK